MNCRSVREQLWSDPTGMLPAAVESHLQDCARCAEAAAEVKHLQSWLRDLPAEEPSEQFDWRLRLRLSRATTASEPLPRTRTRWMWHAPMQFVTSMAAAAVLVLALGLLWNRDRGAQPASGSGSLTVSTPGSVGAPVPAPEVVQVRGRSGFDAARLETSSARSDSDSIRSAPVR